MFQLLVLRWGRSPRERSGETPVPASGHSCPGKVRGEGSEVVGQTDNNQTFCQAWWERGYDHNRGARNRISCGISRRFGLFPAGSGGPRSAGS